MDYDEMILRSFSFSHPFKSKVFAFTHPTWDKVFAFSHPKKLYLVRSIIVPPQQQEEKEQRLLLLDLSAAPQIKRNPLH